MPYTAEMEVLVEHLGLCSNFPPLLTTRGGLQSDDAITTLEVRVRSSQHRCATAHARMSGLLCSLTLAKCGRLEFDPPWSC